MPMPLFPYAQGGFFRAVETAMENDRENVRDYLNGPHDVGMLAAQRAANSGLGDQDKNHFLDHWLKAKGGGSVEFSMIPPDVIKAVLKEGFRKAVSLAEFHREDSDSPPLPISVAWVCNADPHTFEVVCLVHEKKHVQVLVVTPAPTVHPIVKGKADHVHVTRYFASENDVKDVEHRLELLQAPPPKRTPKNAQNQDVTVPEAGSFQIYT